MYVFKIFFLNIVIYTDNIDAIDDLSHQYRVPLIVIAELNAELKYIKHSLEFPS